MTTIFLVLFVVGAHCQYYQWPQQQQYNNFQQPQQYYPQQYGPQPQYYQQPQQQFYQPQQPQQYQPPQVQYQQQQQPQQQYQQQPQPPPIYSQTVVIPQAPPPPPEAYQAQQYSGQQQQPPVMVAPADIPRYHKQPQVVVQPAYQENNHIERARSVSAVELESKLFREQPNNFGQGQEKATKRVNGGNFHSSSATVPRVTPAPVQVVQQPQPQQPQQQFQQPQQPQQPRVIRPPPPPQPRVVTRPLPPPTRRPPTQAATRPAPKQSVVRPQPVTQPATKVSHLAPQPAPVEKPTTASGKFLQCCRGRKVAKSCERICSFDVLSKKTLTGMFLGTDACPQHHGLDLMQCAADNDDHTQCCLDMEVDRTSAGKKCLGFCNMKPGVTFQADVSMLPCWSVLNDIKQCFKENLERQLA